MIKNITNLWVKKTVDFLFYSDGCLLCKRHVTVEAPLCETCYTALPWLGADKCSYCDLPTTHAKICAHCLKQPFAFEKLSAAFEFSSPISQMIYKLKFSEKLYVAKILALWMMEKCILHYDVDCMVAVPLHPSRQRKRGFNQAWELAKEISKRTQIEAVAHGYQRVKATAPQISLAYRARQANVSFASFEVSSGFKNQNVLIIEDVVTTGATVNALAQAFKRAGAKTVQIWACCRTALV